MSRFFPNYAENKITSRFGWRTLRGQKNWHNGIDLVAKGGNNSSHVDYITAHTAGVVSAQGYDAGAGNYVQIDVADNVTMVYYHMKDGSVTVKRGDKVKKGQVIGYMGSTGNSTGAHLHFGIKVNGEWIDPEPYLEADYPIKGNDENAGELVAGAKVTLNKTPCYSSETAKEPYDTKSGSYYLWSAEVSRGRVKITNRADRVGVRGQVTCFVNVADIMAKDAEHSAAPEVKIDYAQSLDKKLAGNYKVNADVGLNLRAGASTSKTSLEVMPNGSTFRCYGYYTGEWLYGVSASGKTGFASKKYLVKQ